MSRPDIPQAQPAQRYAYLLSAMGTLISRAATLVVLIVLPAEIGLKDYGLFALVLTMGEIIEMTTSNWYRLLMVRQSVNRDVASRHDGSKGVRIYLAVGAATAIALAGTAFAAPLVTTGQHGDFALAVSAYIIAFILFRLVISVLQAMGRQGVIGVVELLRGMFTLAFVLGVTHFGPDNFFAASIALAGATALAACACAPAVWRELLRVLADRLEPGTVLRIGAPVVIATVLTFQIGWLDRFVLQHWLGPESVGLYVAVMAIARQPIDLMLNALNAQTFPVLMARGSDGGAEASRNIAGVLVSACIIGLAAMAAIIALADQLAAFALPKFNRDLTLELIPLIALGSLMLSIKHFVFDNIFHAHGQNWAMLRWFAVVSLCTLGMSLALIPVWGPTGAAISFVAGSFLGLISSIMLSQTFCKISWPVGMLLRVLICAVIAGAAARLGSEIQGPALLKLAIGGLAFGGVYLGTLHVLLNFRLSNFLSEPWKLDGLRGASS